MQLIHGTAYAVRKQQRISFVPSNRERLVLVSCSWSAHICKNVNNQRLHVLNNVRLYDLESSLNGACGAPSSGNVI